MLRPERVQPTEWKTGWLGVPHHQLHFRGHISQLPTDVPVLTLRTREKEPAPTCGLVQAESNWPAVQIPIFALAVRHRTRLAGRDRPHQLRVCLFEDTAVRSLPARVARAALNSTRPSTARNLPLRWSNTPRSPTILAPRIRHSSAMRVGGRYTSSLGRRG